MISVHIQLYTTRLVFTQTCNFSKLSDSDESDARCFPTFIRCFSPNTLYTVRWGGVLRTVIRIFIFIESSDYFIINVCTFSYFSATCTTCSCVSLGLSDIPGEAMVKLYCPKCMDVYTPKSSRHHHTDGAYFGTGFPHMLFMVHPEYRPKRPANQFVPRYV